MHFFTDFRHVIYLHRAHRDRRIPQVGRVDQLGGDADPALAQLADRPEHAGGEVAGEPEDQQAAKPDENEQELIALLTSGEGNYKQVN